MYNVVISFSIKCSTTKIVFVNTLLCQMKFYSKTHILHFFCQKVWLLKLTIHNVRSITKSGPAIETVPTTYCNISPLPLPHSGNTIFEEKKLIFQPQFDSCLRAKKNFSHIKSRKLFELFSKSPTNPSAALNPSIKKLTLYCTFGLTFQLESTFGILLQTLAITGTS